MRLAADAVRAGLLHPDGEVRSLALEYFGEAFSPDPEVMPTVIRAAEQFGPDEVGNSRYLAGLKQSPESVRWLAAQIARLPADEDFRWKSGSLRDAILAAELPVLAAVAGELDATPGLDGETRAAVRARVALAPLPPEELWARLEAAGRAMDALDEYPPDAQLEAARGPVAALARHPAFAAERALGALRDKAVEGKWLEISAAELAGRHLRLAEAIPDLIARLEIDDDAMNEAAPEALCAIGTDAVIDPLLAGWDRGDWGYRFSVSQVLGAVHTEKSLTTALDLAAREKDRDLRCRLYDAAIVQFDTAAVEPVRRFVPGAMPDPEVGGVRDRLVAMCELVGQRFPEFERWKLEGARERERVARRIAEWERAEKQARAPAARTPPGDRIPHPDTIVRDTARVGRNDPCPCGSGKKFKKCCGANRPDA